MKGLVSSYSMFNTSAQISIEPYEEPSVPGLITQDNSIVKIDGGVTYLKELGTTVFNVKRFEMINGAVLVIGPSSLVISTKEFVCGDAKIVSYLDVGSQGPDGQSRGDIGIVGGDGQSGGRMKLQIGSLKLLGASLIIDLQGQAGGNGGNGAKGKTGKTGARGSEAVEGTPVSDINGGGMRRTCKHSAGDGKPGGIGDAGGDGGDGGTGGIGGTLVIAISEDDINKISIAAGESKGGKGGVGGEEGDGGQGGKKGKTGKRNICVPRGKKGPSGPKGAIGTNGKDGINGLKPRISIVHGAGLTKMGRSLEPYS